MALILKKNHNKNCYYWLWDKVLLLIIIMVKMFDNTLLYDPLRTVAIRTCAALTVFTSSVYIESNSNCIVHTKTYLTWFIDIYITAPEALFFL